MTQYSIFIHNQKPPPLLYDVPDKKCCCNIKAATSISGVWWKNMNVSPRTSTRLSAAFSFSFLNQKEFLRSDKKKMLGGGGGGRGCMFPKRQTSLNVFTVYSRSTRQTSIAKKLNFFVSLSTTSNLKSFRSHPRCRVGALRQSVHQEEPREHSQILFTRNLRTEKRKKRPQVIKTEQSINNNKRV